MQKALLLACAVLLLACPGSRREDYSQSSPSQASNSTQNPQPAPVKNETIANPTVPPQRDRATRIGPAAVQSVDVQLTEYTIRMPQTLAAGTQTLKIANAGKSDHNFVIEGPGVHSTFPDSLMRGDTRELEVNLTPGTYTVYCPVDGHRGKGMELTVTVK